VEGGGIYKCECGCECGCEWECEWDHCCVLSGCLPSQSFFIHLPMKMEQVEGSETSDIRTKTPGNYPKKNILHIEHGERVKSSRQNVDEE